MKKTIIILTLLSLFAAGCRQTTKKQAETTNNKIVIEQNSKKIEGVITIPMENGEENFNVFLEKFGTDSVFQVSRIVFPLEIIEYGFDGEDVIDSIVCTTINAERYEFMTGFASSTERIEIYGYEYPTKSDIEAFMVENEVVAETAVRSTMKLSEDEYFVHCFALETGGRAGYHFKKDGNGQWYLMKIDARST
jgi:hypothetical protein